jgi:sucrose-6-phosphate hydrolase SacC (GH32 family)
MTLHSLEVQEIAARITAQAGPADSPYSHFFCISPDAPTNPVIYWMGPYDEDNVRFQLAQAAGPYRLDLGDIIYAPNILDDPSGRCILWAWAQEHRTVGSYDFAGCMATPRVLLRRDGRLVQQPLPELKEVRCPAALWPSASRQPGSHVVHC